MTTTSKLVQRLNRMGITNGRELAARVSAPAVIYFLLTEGPNNRENPRAELHYRDPQGASQMKLFTPDAASAGRLSAIRRSCLEQAQKWACDELSIVDWRRAGFQHCWLPGVSIARIRQELKDYEGEHPLPV